MKALVVSTSGALTAAQAQQRDLPVVLIQGGIHAGEIDGKDAGFLALREILEGKAAKGALDKLVWVFVPVFNVDGHERFGAWNRPNQRGPVEMGWRTTAQNYNLNRDYVKADTPEMQAMLALLLPATALADAVIGTGTAASCETQQAANDLSTAVAAGGTITFNCGPAMVTIVANTNATDQTVVEMCIRDSCQTCP